MKYRITTEHGVEKEVEAPTLLIEVIKVIKEGTVSIAITKAERIE